MELQVGTLMRFGLINLMLIKFFSRSIVQEEGPNQVISLKKIRKKKNSNNVGFHSDIYRPLSFKFGIFDTGFFDRDLHRGSNLYEKAETSALIFWQISRSVWMKFGMLHGVLVC